MKTLTIMFFTLLSSISFGQSSKYDTLLFANKKYPLEVAESYKVGPFDFPFAIAEQHYKVFYTKKNKSNQYISDMAARAKSIRDNMYAELPGDAGSCD